MIRSIRTSASALWAAGLLLIAGAPARAAVPQTGEGRPQPWSPEIVALAEGLPVQDGGRVKPLHTYASFTLLRLNGRRSLETPGGERLSAVEWLLDTLFFPEVSADYHVFLVQNEEVVEAVGIPLEGKKRRDRYSFRELGPGIERLFELAGQYSHIEEKDRTSVQQQVFLLATNVDAYMGLAGNMDFAREVIRLGPGGGLERVFGGRAEVGVDEVLAELRRLLALREEAERPDEARAASEVLMRASDLIGRSDSLAMIPPAVSAGDREPWLTPADVFFQAFHSREDAESVQVLSGLVALARSRSDPAAFEAELSGLSEVLAGRARERGEYGRVGLELAYYKSRVLDYAHYGFVLAFLLMAFLWLRPRSRVLHASTSLAVLVSTLLLVAAIVVRCAIRGRPPVSTLYETVLFVTAVGALLSLFIEAVNRRKVAISAGAVVGAIGLFIANGYEMLDKRDTMPSLVAVLDTNFWLATHVTSITIGYSAGMLAALLASAYLLTRLVGARRGDPAFHKSLAKMVYGVLCFALIFSTVGTILGGIWANDSWGRFWGWDPKENGALLIVITQLVILHARMGGYLRDHGVCMAAAFGGTVIAFSWWGVNLLGVGLHSYGFTSGISKAVWTYYVIQWGIVGLGGLHLVRTRSRATR